MDCRKMEELISPYLDGELSPQETELVRSHLSVCANCGQELETLRRIASACRELGRVRITAPVGFKDALMDKISEQPAAVQGRRYGNWLRPAWKKTLTGLAATVMLAVGALSMNTGPIMQIADRLPAISQPVSNTPVTTPTDNGTASPDSGSPNKPWTASPNPIIAQDPGANGSAGGVFLNQERYIVTTLLRVKAADSTAALEQARQISVVAQAQFLNLGQQVGENGSYTAVKITVAKTHSADLIARLSSMGTVIGQDIDKNDITARYADALSQYQSLVNQLAVTQDVDQNALLTQQIADLAAELQNWEKQAEQETIVLWLE